jgi:ABC-type transport system involved in cytochrome bd biosynthesis fused ATPase/permease subunit
MTDTMSKAGVGYERIREVIETEDTVGNLPGAKKAPDFRGEIEFDHVYFAYENNYGTLNDINLHVEPGQLAALVGPTGAGKTTIASLIGRFYDPVNGEDRWPRRAELQTEVAATPDEFRFTGYTSLPRTGLAKHRLRQTGGFARGDFACGGAGERG